MRKPFTPLYALLLAAPALAHEGHGMPGAQHWHATDLWGFIAALAVIIVGLWLSRGGK